MKFSKNAKRSFAGTAAVSLLLSIASVNSIPAASAANWGAATLADDSLIVVLNQHANSTSAKASILNEAKANTLHEMHSQVRDYSILQVRGPSGQREATLANIQSMIGSHPEIKSVSRNYLRHKQIQNGNLIPNDPDIGQQWPLAAMNWFNARINFGNFQHNNPAIVTILSQGVNPVATNAELGTFVKQWNAIDPTVTPFPEPVSGLPFPTGAEGDLDASLPGALTGNGVDVAGAACFVPSDPCRISMLQMTNSDSASDAQIANAVLFRINNQKHLGGAGPVNLSFGSGTPNRILKADGLTQWTPTNGKGDPPLWEAAYIQEAGQDLLNEGSIFVLAAGDNISDGFDPNYPGGTYQPQIFDPTGAKAKPDAAPGTVVVVQASANDSTNAALLTQVVGDPVYAPGDFQPAIIAGSVRSDFYGSSFSAPQWCSAIAMLMSITPGLTAANANAAIINTGIVGSGVAPDPNGGTPTNKKPTTPFVIPDFNAAIHSIL